MTTRNNIWQPERVDFRTRFLVWWRRLGESWKYLYVCNGANSYSYNYKIKPHKKHTLSQNAHFYSTSKL